MKKAPPKAARSASSRTKGRNASPTAAGTTTSGATRPGKPENAVAEHGAEQQKLALSMPFNANKAAEYGAKNAAHPPRGANTELPSPTAGASTLSETHASAKTGKPALQPAAPD